MQSKCTFRKKNDEHAESGNKRIHFFMWHDDERFWCDHTSALAHARLFITITFSMRMSLLAIQSLIAIYYSRAHTHYTNTRKTFFLLNESHHFSFLYGFRRSGGFCFSSFFLLVSRYDAISLISSLNEVYSFIFFYDASENIVYSTWIFLRTQRKEQKSSKSIIESDVLSFSKATK